MKYFLDEGLIESLTFRVRDDLRVYFAKCLVPSEVSPIKRRMMAKLALGFYSTRPLCFIPCSSDLGIWKDVKIMEESPLPLAVLFISITGRQPYSLLPCVLNSRAQRNSTPRLLVFAAVRGSWTQLWPGKCKWLSVRDSRENYVFLDKRYLELYWIRICNSELSQQSCEVTDVKLVVEMPWQV